MELPDKLPALKYIGIGVTEAGLVEGSQVMKDLADFLHQAFLSIPGTQIYLVDVYSTSRGYPT